MYITPEPILYDKIKNDIENGLIKIPQFQRKFVWEKEKRKISLSDYKNKKMNITNINVYKAIDIPSIEKVPNNISDVEYNYNFSSIDKYTIDKDFLKENV